MMVGRGTQLIGVRHRPDCLCGCHHVVGLQGVVSEVYREYDLVIALFYVPNAAGGPSRKQEVAYSLDEAADAARKGAAA